MRCTVPTRRNFRSPRRSSSTRRRTAWADTFFALSELEAGGLSGTDLLAGYRAAGGNTAGVTVKRIFVEQVPQLAVGAQTSQGNISSGIYVDDIGEVIADLDTPVGHPYSSWMSNRIDGINSTTLTAPVWTDPVNSTRYEVRSMRKLSQLGMTVWFVTQFNVSGGATSVSVNYHFRTLLLLP
jgi:hypothetical protein